MSMTGSDPFLTADGRARCLRGVAINSGTPCIAEMAIRIGFETVWIDMEHGPTDFTQAESICLAAEAAGGVPTIRVSDRQRCHVLKALEVGARVVVVPMINRHEEAEEVVRYGKFPPLGERGYNTRSRGLDFGLDTPLDTFERVNRTTHLIAQIETRVAVQNFDKICGVDGLSGILVGPGDLSMSLGCGGEFNHPMLIETAVECIRKARAAGKHAGVLTSPGPLLDAALDAGCDLYFCGGDVASLAGAWTALLAQTEGGGEA